MDFFGVTVQPIVAFFLFGELAVLVVLLAAFVYARIHKGAVHHYMMLVAFLADLLILKPLMFSRASSTWGAFPWDGTRIAPHFLVSLSVVVLGVITVILGFKFRVKKGSRMFLPPKGRMHKIIGWAFLGLWAATFVIGLVIFKENYLG